MNKKLVIPFGEYQIVAQIDDYNVPDIPPELVVWVEDKDGCFAQDVCLVRQSMSYNMETGATDIGNNAVQCLVWGDPNNEDLTNDFVINVRKENDE